MRKVTLGTSLTLFLSLLASCAGMDEAEQLDQELVITPPSSAPLANLEGTDLVISPDGNRILYVSQLEGTTQLYLHPVDAPSANPIPGTEGVTGDPFFSPDGESVAFFADGKLKRVSLTGGEPVTLCDAPAARGGSWADNTILFSATSGSVAAGEILPIHLYRVSPAGGEPEELAVPDPQEGEREYRWPQMLPGGQAVLFTVFGRFGFQTAVLSLESREHRIVFEEGRQARYLPTGHVVYEVDGTLKGVSFDLARLEATDDPIPLLEGVRKTAPRTGSRQAAPGADYTLSDEGTLVYVPGGFIDTNQRTLVWVDRQGEVEPLSLEPGDYRYPRISPDGRQLIVTVGSAPDTPHVWLYDLEDSPPTRLTLEGGNTVPIWTPNGDRVVFSSNRRGQLNLFWKSSDRQILDPAEWLLPSDYPHRPLSVSPDERELVFSETHPLTGLDLWVLELGRAGKPRFLLLTRFDEFDAMPSPDGRWLAYVSNATVQNEVYVLPYPPSDSDEPRQISTNGGTSPAWTPDGRELFYLEEDRMMAVTITRRRPDLEWEEPRELFSGRFLHARPRSYDVARDLRFLMIQEPEEDSEPGQLNIIPNWTEELKRLVPTDN